MTSQPAPPPARPALPPLPPRPEPVSTAAAPTPAGLAEPAAPVDSADLPAVWNAVLLRLSSNRALGWVRLLQLERLESGRAVLSPLPGRRDVAKFAGPRQLAPVAAALGEVLGRRVDVAVDLPQPSTGDTSSATPGRASSADRREALDLPLVRRILDVFPDANLIGVEDEHAPDETPDD